MARNNYLIYYILIMVFFPDVIAVEEYIHTAALQVPSFYDVIRNNFGTIKIPDFSTYQNKMKLAYGFVSNLFPKVMTCNSRNQFGSTCYSCYQVLRCFPNDIGFLSTCSGIKQHCNNGYCSGIKSKSCQVHGNIITNAATSSSPKTTSRKSTKPISSTQATTNQSTNTIQPTTNQDTTNQAIITNQPTTNQTNNSTTANNTTVTIPIITTTIPIITTTAAVVTSTSEATTSSSINEHSSNESVLSSAYSSISTTTSSAISNILPSETSTSSIPNRISPRTLPSISNLVYYSQLS